MVESGTPRAGRLLSASVSPARLVVRRLGCRLGCSSRRSGRFRPLVSNRSSRVHQSAGASGDLFRSPALSSAGPQLLGGRVLRQHDGSCLSEESGGHQVGGVKPDCSRPSPVVGAPLCEAPTAVHYGPQQCLGRFPVAAEPDSGFGMDPEDVCVPATSAAVASSYRPVCNLVKSPLHILFFSLPRSQFHRDGFASLTVGWVAGVCLSSLCADSSSSQEAPLVLWGANDDHSTLLAPEAVVSGALGDGGERASGSASGQRSAESTSFPSAASGSVKASSSCVETIQRFVRSMGFSRQVAKQATLARKPSSRAGYQDNGWCIGVGVRQRVILSLALRCLRSPIFCSGLGDPGNFRFRP